MQEPLLRAQLTSLPRVHGGKVRDIFEVDEEHWLIVASDRLSAFDVVFPDPIPGKGAVLTALSLYWFDVTREIVPNHATDITPEEILANEQDRAQVAGRAMVVRRLEAIPVEAVVRGYLAGSGWRDYCSTGAVCGIRLPAGLRLAERLPEPLFTPASKAAQGTHDENIAFDELVRRIGKTLADNIRQAALRLYEFAARRASEHGIIIADTKFEFGLDAGGKLVLIDEALTPDSSRFWPAESWQPSTNPPSFDKQYVRDWLEASGWNKRPPAPHLPGDVIRQTAERYQEARRRLIGSR